MPQLFAVKGENMFEFLNQYKPSFGRVKLIDQDFYTLVVDCNGAVQPMSYCSAIENLKGLGFEREEKGVTENGNDFETWRLGDEKNTRTNG